MGSHFNLFIDNILKQKVLIKCPQVWGDSWEAESLFGWGQSGVGGWVKSEEHYHPFLHHKVCTTEMFTNTCLKRKQGKQKCFSTIISSHVMSP